MYHSVNPYSHRRRSGAILPFLILIIVGLTLVFAFNIVQYFRERGQKLTENKAALTVISGRAEMKVWGSAGFVSAPTGSILREGDALKVFPSSRVSMTFLNGSYLRADSDTAFTFTGLRTKDGQDSVNLLMEYGDVWLKKPKSENVKIVFTVATEDFTVNSVSTVFAVSKRQDFRVRVLNGNVEVNVKEKVESGKTNVIETIPVSIGQEFIASSETLQAFRERKTPEVIFAHSDSFRQGEWYSWNIAQDSAAQTKTLSVEEAAKDETKAVTSAPQEAKVSDAASSAASSIASRRLPAPEVIDPDTAHRTTNLARLLVRGKTSSQTQKMIVKNYVGGKEDAYTLQKYAAGSTDWNYVVDEALGNWVSGRNRFVIVAVDAKGEESDATELILTYDKAKTEANFSAPTVTSFNGSTQSEVSEDTVKVEGKIGKGIVKVYVNDFALTQYVPDSEAWVYFAKVAYGNLKDGVNEYKVYGVDAAGNKTPVTTFTITKKTAPTEPNSQEQGSPLE